MNQLSPYVVQCMSGTASHAARNMAEVGNAAGDVRRLSMHHDVQALPEAYECSSVHQNKTFHPRPSKSQAIDLLQKVYLLQSNNQMNATHHV